jgi:hypothetical protein
MRTYVAFYNSKQIVVTAASSYEAQEKAAAQFKVKPKYSYKVAIVLADTPVDTASL